MDVLSMLKHSIISDDTNPIMRDFEIGRQIGSAGPEMVWKIFEAVRQDDKKEASVFIFDKKIADKLHKPRRRETVSEILRKEVHHLSRIKHPKILTVFHGLEECHDSLAFATEPVMGSLANILGNFERMPAMIPQELKDYVFIELEIKHGILQITEALSYLHCTEQMLHRNICPQSILVTKRGVWKLAGLGFVEKPKEGKDTYPCQPWTTKIPKMAQPDLNYVAPEIQLEKSCNTLSDMFSLGMVVCSIFNQGKSLINAEHNPSQYSRQVDQMHEQFSSVAHKMPLSLVEPTEKMINRDIRYRPTSQSFSLLRYFQDTVVASLQHIDMVDRQDPAQKAEAYANLAQIIPMIPRKILYKNVFPIVCSECKTPEIVFALPVLLTMIDFAPRDDYIDIILPEFRTILCSNKPVQATVYILNKLDVVLAKSPLEDIKAEVLPLVFNTLDSSSLQLQEAALGAIGGIKEYLDDTIIKKMVLPRAKSLFYRSTNVKLRINALSCIDHMLDSLDKMIILDEVLPFLTDITCQDPDVVMHIVGVYKHMLSDKKFGLTHNLIASKVMPSLIPHTVNPGLTMEQFGALMEVLREMLEQIDRQRRNKMKQETVSIAVPSRGSLKMTGNDELQNDISQAQRLLMVDVGSNKFQHLHKTVTSTPELQQRPKSSPKTNKRNHSLQSLGMSLVSISQRWVFFFTFQDEKSSNTLDKPMEIIRRHSLVPPNSGQPTISITSEDATSPDQSRRPSTHSLGPFSLSVSGFGDYHFRDRRRPSSQSLGILPISLFGEGGDRPRRPSTHSLGIFPLGCFGEERDRFDRPRRPSTHSLGPIVVPDVDRRGSRGSIFGSLGIGEIPGVSSQNQRRPSFQAFGESVMQLFTSK
ncbi:SCY1-like protein 2 [Gigantopelta aegis]|uniref:SCY1-like protein 2 n=1 Tax=Gigantopelta aegis TaxID=1735272 RepID=UPI001B887B5F|nr:SCY1-like protein 2 [Gigantopelta aegis]